ncbi:MAG: iron uptake porin [Cyanobacteriota bacterium]|nr:iron uptake porin [Cyanobacteriota bacterium]
MVVETKIFIGTIRVASGILTTALSNAIAKVKNLSRGTIEVNPERNKQLCNGLVLGFLLGAGWGNVPSAIATPLTPLADPIGEIDIQPVDLEPEVVPSGIGGEPVTSVEQLRDVRPTDWAWQALQSLADRYGCLEGYADGTFRGNRALSRYEFAAGLNACLNQIHGSLTHVADSLINTDDLETIETLQAQFSKELATLSSQIDDLDIRSDRLESQNFSPTTTLNGQTWLNFTGASSGGNVRFEGLPNAPADDRFVGGRDQAGNPLVQQADRASPTLSTLTWLTLNTSFTGRDTLSMTLAAGNGSSPINEFVSAGFFATYGNPYTDQSANVAIGQTTLTLQDLFYSVPLNDDLQLTVGSRISWFSYFDFNRFTYFLTGAGSFASAASSQSSPTFWGAGAVLEWAVDPQWRLAAAYLGENIAYLPPEFGFNTASNPSFGLFGGTYSATTELAYTPNDDLNLRLRYTYSRLQAYGGQVGGSNAAPLPYGYVDAGPGFSVFDPATGNVTSGGLDAAYSHTVAFNFDWLLTPRFGIFGRYSYGNTNLRPIGRAVNTQAFQVGVGFPDLGKPGALGVLTWVVPMDILQGRQYFVSGGGNGGTIHELEASYYYPLSDNLAIVPSFYAIVNSNNFNGNPNIYVGNLRAQFSF